MAVDREDIKHRFKPLKVFPVKYRAWRDDKSGGGYRSFATFEEALACPGVERVDKLEHEILWFHDMEKWRRDEC